MWLRMRSCKIWRLIQTAPIANFILQNLSMEQRKHAIWDKLIYVLESRDEVSLPFFNTFQRVFSIQSYNPDRLIDGLSLSRWYPQFYNWIIIIQRPTRPLIDYDSVVLSTDHDKTLNTIRKSYYWLRMKDYVKDYVARCVTCAQHKGTIRGPAPMLQYPHPEQPGTW